MKKIISFVGLFAVLGVGIGDAHGVAMSAQVRRLLQEKQEKIEQLEKCEGKKQGWMIAGISTIGLTAVGVGVNIAQASKSNRLSDEIEMEKTTLQRHQNELNRIQNDIAAERARQSEANKCCDMKRRCCECEKLRDGDCPGGDDDSVTTYSDYVLSCKMTMFTFRTGQVRDDLVDALNKACYEVTKQYMERTETNGFVKYECKDYREKANCDKQQNDKECPDITYGYAWPLTEPYLSKIRAKLAEYESRCVAQGGSFEYEQATTGTGEMAIGGGKAVCKNRTKCDSNEETDVNIEVEEEVVNPVPPVNPKKDCRTSYGKKPTADCPCDGDKGLLDFGHGKCECKPGEEWNGSKCVKEKKDTIAERVLGQPCWKSDLPTDATEGIYWERPGNYQCRHNSELVKCSCQVTKCKGDLVIENYEKCVKKNLVTDCSEGYVRIGGKGDCVKRDYLFTDQCECAKDPSKTCKLDTDHGGDLVCQLAKGIGKKCKCEDCPKGESWNGSKCVNPTDEAKDTKSAAYCVKHVRDYLVRECPKCISNKNGLDGSGFWDYMGESICADIANNGGFYSIKWDGNTDTATLFLLWANQNQFSTKIECPRECGKL